MIGDWRDATTTAHLHVKPVKDRALVQSLSVDLHSGEAAAIALALETPGCMLIIDEHDGRAAARRLGVMITGTLGIVIAAKHRGFLKAVHPIIEELRTVGGLWLGEEIVRHALELAGER